MWSCLGSLSLAVQDNDIPLHDIMLGACLQASPHPLHPPPYVSLMHVLVPSFLHPTLPTDSQDAAVTIYTSFKLFQKFEKINSFFLLSNYTQHEIVFQESATNMCCLVFTEVTWLITWLMWINNSSMTTPSPTASTRGGSPHAMPEKYPRLQKSSDDLNSFLCCH